MENSELRRQLEEITREFNGKTNPPQKNKKLSKQLKTLGDEDMQDALNYIRVCTKYIIYDLEATRRENAYLRKLLEDNGIR